MRDSERVDRNASVGYEEKVSVIVPIYNVESYLRRCLDSLARQKHQNIEIIMVDDCSSDGSSDIAKEYAEKYPQFILVQREKNGGLAAARNSGLERVSGDWIAFVDSDDWVTDDYISAMYECAKRDNADIVMSSVYYAYSDDSYKEMSPFADLTTESSHKEKVALCRSYAPTRLYKRIFIDTTKIVFPTDIRRSEDIPTVIPWLTRTEHISILPRPLYFYFQRASSLSNSNNKNSDVSFFPKAIRRMEELSDPGFEKELEFRAISDLMYGMVRIMLESGRPRREVIEQIKEFNKEHPRGKENPYRSRLSGGKRIFIFFAEKRCYMILKMFIWIWNIRQKITKR